MAINTITKYIPLLDEVYKNSSKSAILDTPNVEFVGNREAKIAKMTLDGLGDYSRSGGYTSGSVSLEWETRKLMYDRGRRFNVDAMDDEETAGLAFGRLAGEFIRTKVVPEVDAYCFSKLAGTSNILTGTPADIVPGTTDVPSLIDAATAEMNENEVTEEGRILFISNLAYKGLQDKIEKVVLNSDTGISRTVQVYDGMPVIRVPQSRFYTAIEMYDGTTEGEEAGGYVGKASTGYKINFMIVEPSAVTKVTKHVVPRVFSPEVNQSADAWGFTYRLYGDVFVEENKVAGIYLHRGSTALS